MNSESGNANYGPLLRFYEKNGQRQLSTIFTFNTDATFVNFLHTYVFGLAQIPRVLNSIFSKRVFLRKLIFMFFLNFFFLSTEWDCRGVRHGFCCYSGYILRLRREIHFRGNHARN